MSEAGNNKGLDTAAIVNAHEVGVPEVWAPEIPAHMRLGFDLAVCVLKIVSGVLVILFCIRCKPSDLI